MPVGHFPQVKSPDLKANIQYVWGENPPCNANMHICIIPVSPNINLLWNGKSLQYDFYLLICCLMKGMCCSMNFMQFCTHTLALNSLALPVT